MLILAAAAAILASTDRVEATVPICPNGVTVRQNEPCPVPDPPGAAAGLEQEADALPDTFYLALAMWSNCEQPRAVETARRLGRAGPHFKPNLADLPDCEEHYSKLREEVQLLQPGGGREKADALVQTYMDGIRDAAKRAYDENNYD